MGLVLLFCRPPPHPQCAPRTMDEVQKTAGKHSTKVASEPSPSLNPDHPSPTDTAVGTKVENRPQDRAIPPPTRSSSFCAGFLPSQDSRWSKHHLHVVGPPCPACGHHSTEPTGFLCPQLPRCPRECDGLSALPAKVGKPQKEAAVSCHGSLTPTSSLTTQFLALPDTPRAQACLPGAFALAVLPSGTGFSPRWAAWPPPGLCIIVSISKEVFPGCSVPSG